MGRSIIFLPIIVMACAEVAFPQVADLDGGQIQVGATWEPSTFDLTVHSRHRDLTLNAFGGTLEIGLLSKHLTAFGAIGSGHAEAEHTLIDDTLDFFWQAGITATIWRCDPWSVGLTADARRWEAEDSYFIQSAPMGTDLELMAYRVKPTVGWASGPLTVYGGPVLIWSGGSADMFWGLVHYPMGIESKTEFGGFLGATWQARCPIILTGEGEYSGAGWAAAIGVGYQF